MPASAPRLPAAAMIATAVILLMTGCGPRAAAPASGTSTPASAPHSHSPGTPAAASFSGVWTGTWTRTTSPPGSGTYRWVLHQQGHRITGTLEAGNSACLTKGPLTGHVSGPRILLHAITPAVNGTGQASATYHGTLKDGTLSGTGTVKCSAGTGLATWKLTR
ncbi:MAG TPA: hypothetical protein VFI65_08190 [Streptosporangiaceae bacterium]|nr:hypothetical protein [Streptosporangiaceae bacterium]